MHAICVFYVASVSICMIPHLSYIAFVLYILSACTSRIDHRSVGM